MIIQINDFKKQSTAKKDTQDEERRRNSSGDGKRRDSLGRNSSLKQSRNSSSQGMYPQEIPEQRIQCPTFISNATNNTRYSTKPLSLSNHKNTLSVSSQQLSNSRRINTSLNTMNKFTKLPEFSNHPSNCLKLRVSDKDTLICQLSESLNQKISDLVRLEEMNQRLRVEIQDQCKKADSINSMLKMEVNDREEQLRAVQEHMKKVENEMKENKKRVNVMLMSTYEMERNKTELKSAVETIDRLQTAFSIQESLEIKEDDARDIYAFKLLGQFMKRLRFATLKSRRIREFQERMEKKFLRVEGRDLFEQWKEYSNREKRGRQCEQIMMRECEMHIFRQFRKNCQFSRQIREYQQRVQRRITVNIFCWLKSNIKKQKIDRDRQSKSIKLRIKYLIKKGFKSLCTDFRKYCLRGNELQQANRKAILFHAHFLKNKYLNRMYHWYSTLAVPLRQKTLKSTAHFKASLQEKVFKRWKKQRDQGKIKEQSALQYFARRQKKFLLKLFHNWTDDFHQLIVQKRSQRRKLAMFIKNKYIAKWKLYNYIINKQNTDKQQLIIRYNKCLVLKTFKAIKIYIQLQKKIQKKAIQFQSQKRINTMLNIFKGLKSFTNSQKSLKQRIQLFQNKRLAYYFTLFKSMHLRQINKKVKEQNLIQQHQSQLQLLFKNAFKSWKVITANNNRSKRIIHKQKKDFLYKVFNFLVIGLKNESLDKLRRRCIQQDIMMSSLEQRCTDSIEYANEADHKQLDLITKLDMLSQNIDYLKSEINEKEEFIQSLKQDIKEKVLQIESLSSDLMLTKTEKSDILKSLNHLDNELVSKIQKYELALSEQKTQNSLHTDTIQQMKHDFELKERAMREQYAMLTVKSASQDNYINKLENTQTQLEERCAEALQTGKKHLEESKELFMVVQNLEEEKNIYKDKIDECIKLIEQNGNMYEEKILELRERKNILESENIIFLDKTERQEIEIQELKADVKRLDYQLEAMVSESHQTTVKFIDNLNHNKLNINPTNRSIQQSFIDETQMQLENAQSPRRGEVRNLEQMTQQISQLKGMNDNTQRKQVLSVQDFLRPKKMESSPLKSYISQRNDKFQEQNNTENDHKLYGFIKSPRQQILPNAQQYAPDHKQIVTRRTTHTYLTSQPRDLGPSHPSKNIANTAIDNIQKEVRTMKANTSALKENIERRLQNLNQNLDTDIINLKQKRMNQQYSEDSQDNIQANV